MRRWRPKPSVRPWPRLWLVGLLKFRHGDAMYGFILLQGAVGRASFFPALALILCHAAARRFESSPPLGLLGMDPFSSSLPLLPHAQVVSRWFVGSSQCVQRYAGSPEPFILISPTTTCPGFMASFQVASRVCQDQRALFFTRGGRPCTYPSRREDPLCGRSKRALC